MLLNPEDPHVAIDNLLALFSGVPLVIFQVVVESSFPFTSYKLSSLSVSLDLLNGYHHDDCIHPPCHIHLHRNQIRSEKEVIATLPGRNEVD
ncbi:hypothetical protein PM082_024952 [Marasmius tenuissimus]|nr:hypothetical protein PM082_024952 [Marasmius tenuissimus]